MVVLKRGKGNIRFTRFFSFISKPRFILLIGLMICWNTANSALTTNNTSNEPELKVFVKRSVRINDLNSLFNRQSRHPSPNYNSREDAAVGPFLGNGITIAEKRKKKNCGISNLAARTYVSKKSYFANTPEEIEVKQEQDRREKREIKRNEISTDGPLPWACDTAYQWRDMGIDHYPRFVRTAECRSRSCFNGFFRCKPRRYKTKILKRLSGSEVSSCEDEDVSLPESLREQWKFVTVTINLCCDCAGRGPLPESPS